MRSARMSGMVLVCIASMVGCGESLSPPVRGEVGMRDLELVLPAIQGPAAGFTSTPIETPKEWLEGLEGRNGFANIGSTNTAQGYIKGTYLTSGFEKDEFWYQYGMSGFGTGYDMIPWYNISRDGATLWERTGSGIRLNLGIVATSFTPSMSDRLRTGVFCGLTGNVKVTYRVFANAEAALNVSIAAEREVGSSTSQPGCLPPASPSPPPDEPERDTGTGGTGGGTKVTICYYEVWVDKYGRVVDYELLSCDTYVVYQS